MHSITKIISSTGKHSVKNGSNDQLSSSARVSTITSNVDHDDDDINDWDGGEDDKGDVADINFINVFAAKKE